MDTRQKLQVKEDRGHFGLAWSVLGAYAIALVILLDGWHPRTRDMIDFRFVVIIVFTVVGAIGVYGAFASALRTWPHNPRMRDEGRCEEVKNLYLEGLGLFQIWGERTLQRQVLNHDGALDEAALNFYDSEFIERAQATIKWRKRADQSVVNWFGEAACRTFVTGPEISSIPPDWQRGDQWFTNWNQIAGRLVWLQRWLLEQDDL